jgi:hypothetical protein
VKALAVALGVLLILAGNYVLRSKLERTPLPPYQVFPEDRVPISWRLLLPVDMGQACQGPNYPATYHWFTTGTTLVKLFEARFSPNGVFYFLNAALIVCSFAFSWWMFRSAVFSFTLALCMGLSTQFSWVYVCSSIVAHYLFLIYMQANVLCLLKTVETGRRCWQVAFAGTLVLLALCHETWLDYLGFVTLASACLLLYARRASMPELKRRVLVVLSVSWCVAAVYLAIRLNYGRQQYRPGHESEMIFTYSRRTLAVEDFLSNVITYIYLAISNYFPPWLVSSNSLYRIGPERIIAEQHGYHQAQTHLVVMHHLFYWYFWAGIVFAVFAYFLVRTGKTALRRGSVRHAHLFMAMLMVACGFTLHALVKYRPYMSVPLLTYKCMTSNLGVAFLLAGCSMYARHWLPRPKWVCPTVIALAWGVIVYGALARPAYLSHLSHQVGMGSLPDPRRNLRMRRAPRAVEAPAPAPQTTHAP